MLQSQISKSANMSFNTTHVNKNSHEKNDLQYPVVLDSSHSLPCVRSNVSKETAHLHRFV